MIRWTPVHTDTPFVPQSFADAASSFDSVLGVDALCSFGVAMYYYRYAAAPCAGDAACLHATGLYEGLAWLVVRAGCGRRRQSSPPLEQGPSMDRARPRAATARLREHSCAAGAAAPTHAAALRRHTRPTHHPNHAPQAGGQSPAQLSPNHSTPATHADTAPTTPLPPHEPHTPSGGQDGVQLPAPKQVLARHLLREEGDAEESQLGQARVA